MITGGGGFRKAMTPREMLGAFIGQRGRHFRDLQKPEFVGPAMDDYLLALTLCPHNRAIFLNATDAVIARGSELFELGEKGHPTKIAEFIFEVFGAYPVSPEEYAGGDEHVDQDELTEQGAGK